MDYKKYNLLENWFVKQKRIFRDFREHTLDGNNPLKRRIFINRNSKVLFVAHTDTVHKPKLNYKKDGKVFGTGFDDRLGCHIAYTLSYTLQADLLLTDKEEIAGSTAEYHECKDYNFIVEFDRGGNDAVTYGLDNEDFTKAIKESFTLNWGSFSDISRLETKACCMNLGIGYYKAHDKNSYYIPAETKKQVLNFVKFFDKYKDTKFVRDFKPLASIYGDLGFHAGVYNDDFAYSKFAHERYQYSKQESVYTVPCDGCGCYLDIDDTTVLGITKLVSFRVCDDCIKYTLDFIGESNDDLIELDRQRR